ncbi:MAG TPA: VWA domain-containing protein, partial [Thermoanaerobaculia bacterium]|nr:VWA domain-containing protein [Thermoanaerobaculia bacterium]
MKRFILHPSSFILFLALSASLGAQTVRITDKPSGLVSGTLNVPVVATAPVERLALVINGVPYTATQGQRMTAQVNVGYYIRRLRMRAVGYDAQGNVVGEDEMVVNDPRPPFRVKLQGPQQWPESGSVELHANLLRPAEVSISAVDFYVGEEKVATAAMPPYMTTVDAAKFTAPVYARVVARSTRGEEANDVFFFGERAHASTDVTVQQIPVSVADGTTPLRADQVTLVDNGTPRPIENLVAASDLPLNVILLIDYSESMLEELPVVKTAAKQFARALLRPQDRLAVVGFNQKTFWLTNWTNDWNVAAQAVDRVQPIGETHLYDSVVEMLYQIQKVPGRHALVVLTDGVDQGSKFKLDHLVHYARYAGVPVYPVVKNKSLSRWMKLGVGRLQARRLDRVADETGATYFIIQNERELANVYARIAQELRQQYQIVFYSEADVPDQWRSLRIVSSGGHNLRIPRGYFP